MSDPSLLVEALQLENAALRQQVAQLTDQQAGTSFAGHAAHLGHCSQAQRGSIARQRG